MPGELAAFHAFVGNQLQGAGHDLSPEEALELWRTQHPEPAESDATKAVLEALAEMAAGDRGIPFEEFDREFRRRHGIR